MSEITQELSALSGLWVVVESTFDLSVLPLPAQIALRNPLRWGLTISAPTAAGIAITTDPGANQTAPQGVVLPQAGSTTWSYRLNPGLVQSAWYAYNTGAPGGVLTVIEEIAQQ